MADTTIPGTAGDAVPSAVTPTFSMVQLLPAPATIAALAIAEVHGLDAPALGVIAAVGALATAASVVVPRLVAGPAVPARAVTTDGHLAGGED